MGASFRLQDADQRWPSEAADICNHGDERYPGGRCLAGEELGRRRP